MTLPIENAALEIACRLSGLEAKWLQPFEAQDPFNGELPLRGFISQKPDQRYGALAITHVGEAEALQLIYATPKLHYPFGKDGSFHFPPVKKIDIYEKLDGTNVLGYRYHDAQGREYLTYKLRLSPVLRNSRWGPFLDMWRELLQRYPQMPQLLTANGCQISFEMYGSRNTHLMLYENELAVAVLFGVRNDAIAVPLSRLDLMGVPGAPLIVTLAAGEDPVTKYAAVRAEMETRNRPVEDEKITGMEGTVWYLEEPAGRITLWKCKPESVEAIHWAIGINKKAVLATCWNFLETAEDLNYETLQPLLLEEYQPDDIENFRPHIEECIRQVLAEFEFKERALAEYDRLGLSIHADKAGVMRALSQQFQRAEMKKVFTMIIRNR